MFKELENVIFSKGRFNEREHSVEFVDLIENGTAGEYMTLVNRETVQHDYLCLFAQVHFIARTANGFEAMPVLLVEMFSGTLDSEQGHTESSEAYHLRLELSQSVSQMYEFQRHLGFRAELKNPFSVNENEWELFRDWLHLHCTTMQRLHSSIA